MELWQIGLLIAVLVVVGWYLVRVARSESGESGTAIPRSQVPASPAVPVSVTVPVAAPDPVDYSFDGYLRQLADENGGTWFHSKIVGVTRKNWDGTTRQSLIKGLESFDELTLEPEPDNPADPNAIMVLNLSGEQLGYLDARLAGETTRAMTKGFRFLCFVSEVTGEGYRQRGCNIGIVKWKHLE